MTSRVGSGRASEVILPECGPWWRWVGGGAQLPPPLLLLLLLLLLLGAQTEAVQWPASGGQELRANSGTCALAGDAGCAWFATVLSA